MEYSAYVITTVLMVTSLLSISSYLKVEYQLKELQEKSANEHSRSRRDVDNFPKTLSELKELINVLTNQTMHDEIQKASTNVFTKLPVNKFCTYLRNCSSCQGQRGPRGPPGPPGPRGPQGLPGKRGPKGDLCKSIGVQYPTLKYHHVDEVVNETNDARFECQFFGNPLPKIKWVKSSTKHANISYIINREKALTTSVLQIKNVTWVDRGEVTCIGESILGRSIATGKLDVHLAPRLSLTPSLVTGNVGSNLRFPECKVIANPPAKITWKKGYGQLPLGRAAVENGNLTIKSLRVEDDGYYVCVAENYLGKSTGSVQLKTRPLTFKYKPPFLVKALNSSTINCTAYGYPPSINAKIMMLPNHAVPYTVKRFSNSIEVSTNVTTDGVYRCEFDDVQHNQKIDSLFKVQIFSLQSSSLASKHTVQLGIWLQEKDFLGKYVLCYQGSRDNWSSSKYHSSCNLKTPTVSVFKTTTGDIFGGFTDVALKTYDQRWATGFNTVLFSFKRPHRTIRVQLYSTYQSTCYRSWYGPCYGRQGLYSYSPDRSTSGKGNHYKLDINRISGDYSNYDFSNISDGKLSELEVFYRVA